MPRGELFCKPLPSALSLGRMQTCHLPSAPQVKTQAASHLRPEMNPALATMVRLPPPAQRTRRSTVFQHARGALKRRCAQQRCVVDAVDEYLATWAAGVGFGDGSTPADASAIAFRVMSLDFADALVHGLLSSVVRFVHGADAEVELGIGAAAATGSGVISENILSTDRPSSFSMVAKATLES